MIKIILNHLSMELLTLLWKMHLHQPFEYSFRRRRTTNILHGPVDSKLRTCVPITLSTTPCHEVDFRMSLREGPWIFCY